MREVHRLHKFDVGKKKQFFFYKLKIENIYKKITDGKKHKHTYSQRKKKQQKNKTFNFCPTMNNICQ